MKVTVSVGGRFHAFYLARQLQRRGLLGRLITSYPKFEAAKYGIAKDRIRSVIIKELMERSWQRLPSPLRGAYNPQYLIHEVYDGWAARLYDESDICVSFSGFALHTLRRAKARGAMTVVEKGSSHISHQAALLREECERFGAAFSLPHPKVIEKELKEYEEADYIAIPSGFVKRSFVARGVPAGKLLHVPYGVCPDEFRPVPKVDATFRFVHCGGLTLRKGVHYLLRAFHELNLPGTELWLIGSPTEEIKPFLGKYDSPKIFCKGPYPQRELYKYYSQGSVFTLASVEEGLAMVQPQAMACGLPVICTFNTGGEDIVRDGTDGFVIPARDVEALKEKMLYLYENRELCKEMGLAARKRIVEGFTWDDYGERMVKEYERAVGARGGIKAA